MPNNIRTLDFDIFNTNQTSETTDLVQIMKPKIQNKMKPYILFNSKNQSKQQYSTRQQK